MMYFEPLILTHIVLWHHTHTIITWYQKVRTTHIVYHLLLNDAKASNKIIIFFLIILYSLILRVHKYIITCQIPTLFWKMLEEGTSFYTFNIIKRISIIISNGRKCWLCRNFWIPVKTISFYGKELCMNNFQIFALKHSFKASHRSNHS